MQRKKSEKERGELVPKVITSDDVFNETPQQEEKPPDIMVYSSNAIEAITRSEIDIQISTAKRFPRSIERFRTTVLAMATVDKETAESCFYKLPPRKSKDEGEQKEGKWIEGESIRLAEIASAAYQNIAVGTRTIAIEDSQVVSQGYAFDVENNYRVSVEVPRRIVNRYGKRFSPDMITLTCAANNSIAFRNACFKVIPKGLLKTIIEEIKKVAVGNKASLADNVEKAYKYFSKLGVPIANFLETIGKKTIEEATLEDYENLVGLKTAIKDGDTTVESAFNLKSGPKVEGDPGALQKEPEIPTEKSADGLFPENKDIK